MYLIPQRGCFAPIILALSRDSFLACRRGWVLLALVAGPASGAVFYVDVNSTNPAAPYTSWATAAQVIQDAVDQTANGDSVLVGDGIYRTGARRVVPGVSSLTNRVVVTNTITLASVHGAASTFIEGYHSIPAGTGPDAIRCVYLTNGAVLKGFSFTNGATIRLGQTLSGMADDYYGGGVCCASSNETVIDCTFINDWASQGGGGVYRGTLTNCSLQLNYCPADGGAGHRSTFLNCLISTNHGLNGGGVSLCVLTNCLLQGNMAFPNSGLTPTAGGAAVGSILQGCTLCFNYTGTGLIPRGGAVYNCTLYNCVLKTNTAADAGGGAALSRLNNCILMGNVAATSGGGAFQSSLTNCTVAANNAAAGGGVDSGTNLNCIIYSNSGGSTPNYRPTNSLQLDYCCTAPMPASGRGNITNAPSFLDLASGDLHLSAASSCINAGRNVSGMAPLDLDSNPRIAGGTVDPGAYEFQSPLSQISYQWLQQYALPTDGSADFVDSDSDGMNTWQEWKAGTEPTNAFSLLRIVTPENTNTTAGVTISWLSVATRTYFVQRSTNLLVQPMFGTIATGVIGADGTTSYRDGSTVGAGSYLYRVGVE